MKILSLVLAISFLAGVVSFAAQKAPVSDDYLFDEVRRRLASDPDVKGGTFEVDVKDGVVTVKGVVDKDKWKQKAEKLVMKVKGVKSVVNKIEVKPRGA